VARSPRGRLRQGSWTAAVLLTGLLVGCVSSSPHRDADLDALLEAYRQQNEQLRLSRERMVGRGIERLVVEPGSSPAETLVTADLVNAQIDVVVKRILERAGIGFATGSPRPLASVSARFEKLPLIDALRSLLRPAGLTADLRDGVVAIRTLPAAASSEVPKGPPDDPTSAEVRLSFATTERAIQTLGVLYPEDDSGLRPLQFAPVPERNAVLLSGPRGYLEQAETALVELDVDPGHVLLEALVVEFSVSSFLEIGSRIEQGAKGTLSELFFNVADLVGDTLSFTRVADAANTTQFRAVLRLLMQREEGRILSRPYLATVSGSRARLQVAEDRYVLVTTPGEISVNLEPVSSGVTLDLLPTLLADGSVLLELSVEQSQFQPTLENVQQRRARNTVSTFAHVADGQTVIVGGLMVRARSSSRAGFPGLRRIPPFSLLFGHREETHRDAQVMIFITPYRWEPGMDPPLEEADSFELHSHRRPEGGAETSAPHPSQSEGTNPGKPEPP
jgi:hypothetical protein